jgi:Ca2+-binding RTX toxin-like protein
MKRWIAAGALGAVVVTATLLVVSNTGPPDPGPIPTCDGQQATIVGVAFETGEDYAAWEALGVDVQDSPDGLIRGTTGRDVLVGLVSTADLVLGGGNGFYAGGTASVGPKDQNRQGDLMCGYGDGFDIYYGGRGADRIFDFSGDSHIYAGGCTSTGEGTACDEIHAGDGLDKIWGFRVPAGRTQVIDSGAGWDHNYIGLGQGRIVIDGGPCTAPTGGTCVGAVPGDGDHIHPCPKTDLRGRGMTITGIEYVGPSAPFGDTNDPCAYNG